MKIDMRMPTHSNITLPSFGFFSKHLIITEKHIPMPMAQIDPMTSDFKDAVHRIGIIVVVVSLHGSKAINIQLIRMQNRITAMQKTVFSRIRLSQIFQSDCFPMGVAAYDQFFRFHGLIITRFLFPSFVKS